MSAFAAAHPDLVDPSWVVDRCEEVSAAFARACHEAGVAATVISGARFGEVDQFPGVRLMLGGHFAVLVADEEGDTVFDWTARQFDPKAPVPEVMALSRWRQVWVPSSQW